MATAAKSPRSLAIFFAIAAYVTLRFAAAILLTGGEYPMSPAHYLSMAVDLGLLIGVAGMWSELNRTLPRADPRRSWLPVAGVAGIISGVGLLAIRFTSNAAWWTGYLRHAN